MRDGRGRLQTGAFSRYTCTFDGIRDINVLVSFIVMRLFTRKYHKARDRAFAYHKATYKMHCTRNFARKCVNDEVIRGLVSKS